MKHEEKVVHALFSASHTAYWLKQISAKQAQKKLLNRTVESLMPLVLSAEDLDSEADNAFEEVYDNHMTLLEEIAKVPLYRSGELIKIIKEFNDEI